MGRTMMVVVAMLASVWVGAAEPQWVEFTSGIDEARVVVAESSATVLEFEIELPGISLESVATEAGDFVRLSVPGLGRVGNTGEPQLPALRRFIEVPIGATVEVDVQPLDKTMIDLATEGVPTRLMPVQLPQPKCDCEEARNWRFSYKEASYAGRVEQPAGALRGPYTFRDHQIMVLTLSPVSYDADRAQLEIMERARVTVRFEGGDLAATTAIKERLASRHFDAFLGSSTLNMNMESDAANWSYPDDAPVEFLIITPPQFVGDLQPFVDWKTSCGFNVTVTTTDVAGTSTTAIKGYISGLYNGDNPPVYILMIGDSPSPLVTYTQSGGGYGGTDLPFVQMDGDLYPDMMIARWPIDDSTELINMRDKILHYERPTAANSAWLNRALFIGGDDYGGWTTHQDVIAELFEPPPNNAEADYWDGESGQYDTDDLIADLNTGRAWAVYSAHSGPGGWSGRPAFDSSDIPTMANTDMYPIAHGHSCSSNEWANYDDVFGEVAVIQPDKGFVAYWGGSASTYWDGDDWLERGFFDSMFDADMAGNLIPLDRQYSNVAACYAGLTEVTLWGGDEDYYWHCYNLNGDPTLDPFTRQPIAANVGAPPVVPPAATDDFEVTVTDPEIGPVPLAMVGVSQDGVLLGAGMTDDTGTASFHIDAPVAGSDMVVRVTAHNHLPTDAMVTVAAGSDGVVVLGGSLYRCDSTVSIDVFDDDLGGQGTVAVTLSAQPSGTSTPVILSEIPGSVVRYTGAAVLGADLAVADGDVITVTYYDEDTGGGSAGDKTDTAVLDCAGPVITGVGVVATEGSATVQFSTSEPGTTVVRYGTTVPPTTVVSDPALGTAHSMELTGLDPCTTYFVGVESADALGNVAVDTNGGLYYGAETMGWQVFLTETFDSDPGWEIDNGGNGHGWAFGQPTGGGGEYGEPDPDVGLYG